MLAFEDAVTVNHGVKGFRPRGTGLRIKVRLSCSELSVSILDLRSCRSRELYVALCPKLLNWREPTATAPLA
jgi:hypothetical protein